MLLVSTTGIEAEASTPHSEGETDVDIDTPMPNQKRIKAKENSVLRSC
jgi:hypothetical protein